MDKARIARLLAVALVVGLVVALAPAAKAPGAAGAVWRPWSDIFPYEDWRTGRPVVIDEVIAPWLAGWAGVRPILPCACLRCCCAAGCSVVSGNMARPF